MPVLVAGFVLCCWCQLPAWSVGAGASSRLGLLVPELVAGLMAMLPVPVLVAGLVAVPAAGLVCCSTCQLPASCCAAGASCRLGLLLPA
ncbi:hypothetical protein PR002_g32882 [Phytophthora rubi]|uniref:Uncharacterized protein n=1 Tax=Phytophthora rubi TaxID=129364 RepID=A0A6A3G4U7_9STRA|nr:hypothetical protein PR002_g32882 [Phytophthora rubi]